MNAQDLRIKLMMLARAGLASANQGNPFWSKRDAMRAINGSRMIIVMRVEK